jgi:hypothetical protein
LRPPRSSAPPSPFEATGRCLPPSGPGQPWTLLATLTNPGDAPIAILWTADTPWPSSQEFQPLYDPAIGIGIGASGSVRGGGSTCIGPREQMLVPVYGKRTRRVALDVPDDRDLRRRPFEVTVTLQITLVPIDRPCAPTTTVTQEVSARCPVRH